MKKKKLYMSRIIRVFEAEKGALSTNEIYDMLLSQKSHNGRAYSKSPGKMTLTQILSKCPEFKKVGHRSRTTNGNRERIGVWELAEAGNS